MSERDDASAEADFDDPAYDEIRRLLGEAGSSGGSDPLPAEVAARLDATLAGLVADRQDRAGGTADLGPGDEQTDGAQVLPWRRRVLPKAVIAAAAALVVVGGAIGVTRLQHDDSGARTSGAASAPSSGAPKSLGTDSAEKAAPGGPTYDFSAGAAPALSSAKFSRDVRGVVATDPALRQGTPQGLGSSPAPSSAPENRSLTTTLACPRPSAAATTDQVVPVRVDGRPALLVVHPGSAGSQVVEAYSCKGGGRLASATIPASAPR